MSQDWISLNKDTPQILEGTEAPAVITGEIRRNPNEPSMIMMRHNEYQIVTPEGETYDIYAPGDTDTLQRFATGERVMLQGSKKEFELEGQQLREFWPTGIRRA